MRFHVLTTLLSLAGTAVCREAARGIQEDDLISGFSLLTIKTNEARVPARAPAKTFDVICRNVNPLSFTDFLYVPFIGTYVRVDKLNYQPVTTGGWDDLFYRIKAISDTAAPILAGLQARNSNFDASKCPDIYGSFSNLARAQQQLNQEYLAAEANTTAHGKGRQLVPLLDEMENYLMTIAQQTTKRFPMSQVDSANALTRLADQIFFAIEAAKKVYN